MADFVETKPLAPELFASDTPLRPPALQQPRPVPAPIKFPERRTCAVRREAAERLRVEAEMRAHLITQQRIDNARHEGFRSGRLKGREDQQPRVWAWGFGTGALIAATALLYFGPGV